MDSDTLHTASTYLNNLLLARGLLRNGNPLDFAKPTRDTRAQIINLVHDLVLRRDREQDSREQVAVTLRTLRAEDTRKDAEIRRLQARAEERERTLLQTQSESRSMKAEMRKLDSNAKALHDQLVRLKASVSQIKAQCATDIRKRDLQIERLKTHLQGQQRGNKGTLVAPSMTITGHGSSERGPSTFNQSVRNLEDPEYSLKQETNEFLTQLGQSLSEENDNLIAMVRTAIGTMKSLLGLSAGDLDAQRDSMDDVEDNESDRHDNETAPPPSYDSLATELESTLEVLNTVLTSPNFVSMDEVEMRDDEIARLREGWERMETRWREVLFMMNEWRTRLEKSGGETINLDDLKRGLGLGDGLGEEQANSKQSTAKPRENEAESHATNAFKKHSPKKGIDPPEVFSVRPARHHHLRGLGANFQSPRRAAFAQNLVTNISPSIWSDHDGENDEQMAEARVQSSEHAPSAIKREPRSSPLSRTHHQESTRKPAKCTPTARAAPTEEHNDDESFNLPEVEEDRHLTVEEKLRAAQAEAAEAAEAASVVRIDTPSNDADEIDFEMNDHCSKLNSSPARKTRIKGRPKRRKSTLSPEELAGLMGVE